MSKAEQRKKALQLQKDELLDFKRTFTTPEGKRVLYDLMGFCNFMKPTLNKNNDPIEMAFNEGKRQVVLMILTKCQLNMETVNKFMEIRQGERDAKRLAAFNNQ